MLDVRPRSSRWRPAATTALVGALLSITLITALPTAVGPAIAAARQPVGPPGCPNVAVPPSPVDTSENPPPGVPAPAPLPIPEKPVGGPRMGECGLIQPRADLPAPTTVSAASWIVADVDSGAVLAARDPHARHRPASLIKVLLAIVALRELHMDTVVTGTQEDANQDGTRVGVGPGGQYTVHQLIFALLMQSGNDAAHVLARQLGGVAETLRKMNAAAAELGALDTRAATPSGLDGPGMSSSAYDLALLFRVAMTFPKFAEAISTRQIDFPGYGGRPSFKVNNDNRLLGAYAGFLGGKTGFTDDARHTYVGAAARDGRRLVAVLMRGEQQPVRVTDQASQLLEYGFGVAKAWSQRVGQLVDAPGGAGTPETDGNGSDLAGQAAGSGQPDHSAFGTVGGPLTALAAALAAIVGFLWVRRRRARSRSRTRPRQLVGVGAGGGPGDVDPSELTRPIPPAVD